MLNYSDFLIKQVILGYSTFMIQSSRLFSKNILEVDPPRVTHGKEPIYLSVWLILKQQLLLKHLYLLVTWGKKEGKYMIKKSTLFSIAKYFFLVMQVECFQGAPKCFSKGKMMFYYFQMFSSVLFMMKIHCCIPFVYLTFTSFFLSYVLNGNPHITYRFCEIKATLIVGREVIKGGFLNLCTSFCSINPLNGSVVLI